MRENSKNTDRTRRRRWRSARRGDINNNKPFPLSPTSLESFQRETREREEESLEPDRDLDPDWPGNGQRPAFLVNKPPVCVVVETARKQTVSRDNGKHGLTTTIPPHHHRRPPALTSSDRGGSNDKRPPCPPPSRNWWWAPSSLSLSLSIRRLMNKSGSFSAPKTRERERENITEGRYPLETGQRLPGRRRISREETNHNNMRRSPSYNKITFLPFSLLFFFFYDEILT